MTGKIRALVGCQVQSCAEETSYPLDMVAMWNGRPICQSCFEDGGHQTYDEDKDEYTPDWWDLPSIKLTDLYE